MKRIAVLAVMISAAAIAGCSKRLNKQFDDHDPSIGSDIEYRRQQLDRDSEVGHQQQDGGHGI